MRSILSFLISFLIVAPSWGQMYDPVKWSFNVDVVNENEVDLVIHADIEEGWYVYGIDKLTYVANGNIVKNFENKYPKFKLIVEDIEAYETFIITKLTLLPYLGNVQSLITLSTGKEINEIDLNHLATKYAV